MMEPDPVLVIDFGTGVKSAYRQNCDNFANIYYPPLLSLQIVVTVACKYFSATSQSKF